MEHFIFFLRLIVLISGAITIAFLALYNQKNKSKTANKLIWILSAFSGLFTLYILWNYLFYIAHPNDLTFVIMRNLGSVFTVIILLYLCFAILFWKIGELMILTGKPSLPKTKRILVWILTSIPIIFLSLMLYFMVSFLVKYNLLTNTIPSNYIFLTQKFLNYHYLFTRIIYYLLIAETILCCGKMLFHKKVRLVLGKSKFLWILAPVMALVFFSLIILEESNLLFKLLHIRFQYFETGYFLINIACWIFINRNQLPEFGWSDQLNSAFIKMYSISSREQQIIEFMLKGYANKQIAYDLKIHLQTVKSHVSNIFQKTGTQGRVELIRLIHSVKPDRE